MRIALLDDDPLQIDHLKSILRAPFGDDCETDITCFAFDMGEALRRTLRRETFDLLILDWNVPDVDGVTLLKWMRVDQKDNTPVIILTGRTQDSDLVKAFHWGADDYVKKPFRAMEMRARIERLCKRSTPVDHERLHRFGDWTFDGMRNTVRVSREEGSDSGTVETQLTEREFKLALILFQHLGKPVSRDHLVERSGYDLHESSGRPLDSHIYRLRKKLSLDESNHLKLQTLYGRGYRLLLCDDDSSSSS